MAILWTHYNNTVSFLCRGPQGWTQYSRISLLTWITELFVWVLLIDWFIDLVRFPYLFMAYKSICRIFSRTSPSPQVLSFKENTWAHYLLNTDKRKKHSVINLVLPLKAIEDEEVRPVDSFALLFFHVSLFICIQFEWCWLNTGNVFFSSYLLFLFWTYF